MREKLIVPVGFAEVLPKEEILSKRSQLFNKYERKRCFQTKEINTKQEALSQSTASFWSGLVEGRVWEWIEMGLKKQFQARSWRVLNDRLNSLDFNVIAHGKMCMTSWSDSEEWKHLKAGRSFRNHLTTLKEDVVFVSFLWTYHGRSRLESK